MNPTKRSWLVLLVVAGLILSSVAPAFAQDDQPVVPDGGLPQGSNMLYLPSASNGFITSLTVPADGMQKASRSADPRTANPQAVSPNLSELRLGGSAAASLSVDGGPELARIAPALRQAQGKVHVVVQLTQPSLVEVLTAGPSAAAADATAAVAAIQQQQAQVVGAAQGLDAGARVLGSVHRVLNAVMLEIDAAVVRQLAANPNVRSVRPVVDYQLDLSETVPYIGATAVQNKGFDGKGVKVAVLDSGIDYTHAAMGGEGTLAAYQAAYGTSLSDPKNTTRDGLFPTDKVVEGYDFVGESWPNGPLAPDEDPIDEGGNEGGAGGHGTHVADIIGGIGGVAPGVSLYAVKVCSAVSSSCSGVALLNGMDYAVDPNGDDNLSDRMDIINMSLGSPYGQAFDDDLSQAVENATKAGVLTVASAGNSADKPFIVGSPSAAPSALSVAQTEVPSAKLPVMQVLTPASIAGNYGAVFQPWSAPLVSVIEGPMQYGVGSNVLGCTPFPAGSLTGKVLLVDRGACSVSIKVSEGAAAGAVAVVVGLVAPGDPFGFGFGGGDPSVPGFNISQADANKLKAALAAGAVTVRFDPANQQALVQHVVGSSSRGPTMLTHIIKPEIGAPGASISAIAGSGTGTEAFGGTSGAAPMVSGAAALLKQAYPSRSPAEIKALLVNTGETNIMNKATLFGGKLAPITRIGGGEVRVDRALASPVAAWEARTGQPVISMGFDDWIIKNVQRRPGITVRNYTNQGRTYDISVSFRYPDDEARGVLTITAPKRVFASANSVGSFGVQFRLNAEKLEAWNDLIGPNSGAQGANADLLSRFEYDGYITLTNTKDPKDTIHLPWQILPRKAGAIDLRWKSGGVEVRNRGIAESRVEVYSLIGQNGNQPQGGPGENNPVPDLRYVGYTTIPVPAGFCSDDPSFVMAFAANTFEPQTHANAPFSFTVDIDSDQDGDLDYQVFTMDAAGNLSDGRNLTFVFDASTGDSSAFFFTDHQMKSGNTVMYICGEQIGMNAENFFDPMDIAVYAFDSYFTGLFTDAIEGITISPLGEQYLALFENGGINLTTLAPKDTDMLRFLNLGETTNNSELGLLLLYRDGAQIGVESAVLYASK